MNPLKDYTLQQRTEYSNKLITNYPGCIPVILFKKQNDKILQDIDKKKYLIPKNLNLMDFLCIIRKKISLKENQAIFLFIESNKQHILVPSNATFQNLYQEHRSSDNFLYIIYAAENTFG